MALVKQSCLSFREKTIVWHLPPSLRASEALWDSEVRGGKARQGCSAAQGSSSHFAKANQET